MCHMKTIQDTTFDRKEGWVSQRGGGVERKRDAGPGPPFGPAAAPDPPLPRSPRAGAPWRGEILRGRVGAAEAPGPWCTAFWYGYIV